MIKLFISQPMHGLSDEEIISERNRIVNKFVEAIRVQYPIVDADVTVVNAIYVYKPCPPKDAARIWYLTESIRTIEDADVIIFAKGWDKASGCRVERAVVENYQSMFNDRLILSEGVTGWYFMGEKVCKRIGIQEKTGSFAWS